MAEINYSVYDQTLRAVDKALEEESKKHRPRQYLGMSQIGDDCERKLFYDFRNVTKRSIPALGLRAIQDGFTQEDIMAARLRMVHGIDLITKQNGQQIGFSHIDGHFRGHCDGMIQGILERPEIWHIWEHKSVNESKFKQLIKLREELGEKHALEKWDYVYFCQAQIYMHSAGVERHYLTVTSPGGRDYVSIRTAKNESVINSILQKAHRIIYSTSVPAKISEKQEFYKCKMCEFSEICHSDKSVDRSCGTCKAFKVIPKTFHCEATNCNISNQTPCPEWTINPIFATAKIEKPKTTETKQLYAWSQK